MIGERQVTLFGTLQQMLIDDELKSWRRICLNKSKIAGAYTHDGLEEGIGKQVP